MRLALASDRHRGSLQPRNGNRIWLVTCIVTVLVAVVVVLKVTGSSCPADPRADGVAAVGGASPGPSHPGAGRAGAGGTGAGGSAAGGAGTGGVGASALATSPALARSMIEGHAVFYDPGQAAGSCGLGPFPAGGRYASLPPRSFASGRARGSYLDVYGPRGTVRAEVVDVCTDCAAGSVDLSRAAFARIADPRAGLVAVSYRTALDPPLPGPLVLRISAAARPGTLAVQVINHGNRLSSVAASRPGAGGSGSRRARTATGPGHCARGGPGRARPRAGPRAPHPDPRHRCGRPSGGAHRGVGPEHRAARHDMDVPGPRAGGLPIRPVACPGGAGGPPRRAGRAYGQLLTSPAISGPAGRA